MNLIKSIEGRLESLKRDYKSRYWEYARFFMDDVIWDNTILFESFGGTNFQGNPYYVYKEIFNDNLYKDYHLVVADKNPEELIALLSSRRLIDDRVDIVQIGSAEYRNALAHSKYLVNNVSFNMDFIKKERQVYLNTWHGTPLKCLGRNIKNAPFECNNAQRNFFLCDYLLAPNRLTKTVFEDDYMVRNIMPGEIVLQGYPRNAIFFDTNSRETVRKRYELNGVISIFYMPTWRGNTSGVEDVDQISEIECLAQELGKEYRVYVKFHPAMKKENTTFKYCYEMPNDIEVYEFLNAIDILITDYSSVFFDFANTKKTIILYQYDKKDYFKKRGIYEDVEKQLVFPTAQTYEDLIKAIRANNETNYDKFNEEFCAHDSLNATKDAIQLLLKEEENVDLRKPIDLYIIDFPTSDDFIMELQQKLANTNSQFVFIPKRGNGRFLNLTCFDKINYCVLYTYDRLTPMERIKCYVGRMAYFINKKSKIMDKLQEYGRRERRRLWGNIKIGHVYAKTRHLPTAINFIAEDWPEYLNSNKGE